MRLSVLVPRRIGVQDPAAEPSAVQKEGFDHRTTGQFCLRVTTRPLGQSTPKSQLRMPLTLNFPQALKELAVTADDVKE